MDERIIEDTIRGKTLSVPPQIIKAIAATQKRLAGLNDDDFVHKALGEPSTHLFKQTGKLIRPGILLSTAYALGQEPSDFVNLATGIELLHTASLIHDDILDKDNVRRGDASVHVKYGQGKAILAGDALIAKAIQLASDYGGKVVNRAAEAAMAMCAGEVLDHDVQLSKSIPELDTYLQIVQLKTASLIAVSSSVVADYINSGLRNKLYEVGMNIGMSFQIRDDIMNAIGIKDKAPKSVQNDAANFRPNIVAVFTHHGKPDPLRTAIKLSNFYLDQAAASVGELDGMDMFQSYIEFLRLSA